MNLLAGIRLREVGSVMIKVDQDMCYIDIDYHYSNLLRLRPSLDLCLKHTSVSLCT